jgi:murein L,D-transpeptidase YcbB/YkuD
MQRVAWWVAGIAFCTALAPGCSGGPRPGTESGCDSTHVRNLTDAATVQGAAGGGTASGIRDPFAALWQAVTVYERITAQGGWPTLPDSTRLRIGDSAPAVAALKRRLTVTGDLQASFLNPIRRHWNRNRFDAETEAALRRFQERHGLEPDGILGPRTRAALDVPAEVRAWQLRANLWRAQHAPQLGPGRVIVVNIPDYRLRGFEDGRSVLDMRVVVGTADDPTPSFSDLMTYVVFRPYWNIPTSIALEEIVPQIQRDSRVLQRKDLEVVVAASRDSVLADSVAVDWSRFETSGYMLRRRPGRRNPLGDVKFMFPNQYSVYLHDTPQDNLFRKKHRTFSHGCVRVEAPVDLGEFVLRGTPGWDRESIGDAMWVGETQTVSLPQPIPTHIVYWTAWVDDAGRVQFRDDIYHLDRAVAGDVASVP